MLASGPLKSLSHDVLLNKFSSKDCAPLAEPILQFVCPFCRCAVGFQQISCGESSQINSRVVLADCFNYFQPRSLHPSLISAQIKPNLPPKNGSAHLGLVQTTSARSIMDMASCFLARSFWQITFCTLSSINIEQIASKTQPKCMDSTFCPCLSIHVTKCVKYHRADVPSKPRSDPDPTEVQNFKWLV